MANDEDFVKSLVSGIDSFEPERFGAFLTEDARFRFGNAPEVVGRANIVESVAGFFSLIRKIKHTPFRTLRCEDVIIAEMTVSYIDQWGRDLSVPVCNLLTMRGEKIRDYRIFTDNSALFIPPAEEV